MVDTKSFEVWDVKPKWTISQSIDWYNGDFIAFSVWGVDRVNPTISRPLTRISSLEEYNQGYIEEVEDMRISIFVKEGGSAFEAMRRISTAGLFFKVECSLVTPGAYQAAWMKGFEGFEGCRVVNETVNYAVAEFPVREFEVMALRHFIHSAGVKVGGEEGITDHPIMSEGDGNYSRSI